MDGRSNSQKTPEEIRAERIAAVSDPKLRQELDVIAKARDAKLVQERERQEQTFDKRAAELRDQKIRSANAPQLTPRGMRSPYLGERGHARATIDAKAQIQTLDHSHLEISPRSITTRSTSGSMRPARINPHPGTSNQQRLSAAPQYP